MLDKFHIKMLLYFKLLLDQTYYLKNLKFIYISFDFNLIELLLDSTLLADLFIFYFIIVFLRVSSIGLIQGYMAGFIVNNLEWFNFIIKSITVDTNFLCWMLFINKINFWSLTIYNLTTHILKLKIIKKLLK